MLTAIPLRLRWHVWRRGGRPSIFVWGRYFPRIITDDFQAVNVDIDGKPFGQHLSPFVWTYRGRIDRRAADPLFGCPPPGSRRLVLSSQSGAFWSADPSLRSGESMIVLFRPEQVQATGKVEAATVEAVVVDRRCSILRHVG